MWYFKVGWRLFVVTFLAITLAFLTGAQRTLPQEETLIKRYPVGGQIIQYYPRFDEKVLPLKYQLTEDHPACYFNMQCICSKMGPDLGVVHCDGVELGQVPKELNNTKIHSLTLRNNRIFHLEDYTLFGTAIYRLVIQHNNLLDVPEKAFWGIERSLWELDLQYNQLARVPSSSLLRLRKLAFLDLSGNRITQLSGEDFEGLELSLKTLILSHNSIASLPTSVFRRLEILRVINLEGNNIHKINSKSFQGSAYNLGYLNLANNLIEEIPFVALSYISNLQTLDLSRNLITKTYSQPFGDSLSLDTLILDNNAIPSLPTNSFQNFRYVNRTSLRGNPITLIADNAFKDSRLKELYLHDCEIASISDKAFNGLETFLQLLDLSHNNLTSLPDNIFKHLDAVKSLSLGNNALTLDPKTSFNGFKYSLQYLNLVGEEMGDIPMESLKEIRNVRSLGLSTIPNTILSKEDFKGFGPAVENLYLLKNEINSIAASAFEHVPGIKTLDLSYNAIRSFDNDAFSIVASSIESLRIASGLSLSSLPSKPFVNMANVNDLDISNNNLRSLDRELLINLKKLTILNAEDNKIGYLAPHHFIGQNNPYIKTIQLSFNNIPKIHYQTFHDCKGLKYIFLDDNLITSIEGNAFTNLESLEHLHLQGNNIQYIENEAFQTMPNLRFLDLSFNHINNLNFDAFEQVGTLSTLTVDVSHNRISYLKVKDHAWNSYSGIKFLVFSHNNISAISPRFFDSIKSSLMSLKMDYNNIQNISSDIFSNLPHLKFLDFSNNHISLISQRAFKGSKYIEHVDMRNNKIVNLPSSLFSSQRNLRFVELTNNFIHTIPESLFSETHLEILRMDENRLIRVPTSALRNSAKSLRVLGLSGNLIDVIPKDALADLENLISLDLSHNNLMTLDPGIFFSLKKLIVANVSHNPIRNLNKNSFDGLESNLKILNIANISLTELPKVKVNGIVQLNVSHNSIPLFSSNNAENFSTLRILDASFNEIGKLKANSWTNTPQLQELYLQGNPIRSITEESFRGLDKLEVLDIRNLPLKLFQREGIGQLGVVKDISVSTSTNQRKFNLARIFVNTSSLQKLSIEVDGNLDDQLGGWSLPLKLSNISILGPRLRSISNNALQMLTSRNLKLGIYYTGLKQIPTQFFQNLGKVRFIAFEAFNNSLQTLGEPSFTPYYTDRNKRLMLTDLRISGESWKCDCGIGWIESWIRTWRQSVCTSKGRLLQYIECQRPIQLLRKSRCVDRGRKSIMEAIQKDLECMASSTSKPLFSGFLLYSFFLLWLLSYIH